MSYLLTLPIATAVKDITFTILLAYAILRLPNTWRCYTALVRDRLVWAIAAWTILFAVSILWSEDRGEGLEQLKAFRSVLLPLALWPVLDAATFLIAALLLGVFGLNMIQIAQRLNLFGLELHGADRARGLLHPIQSGAFAIAALMWYMPVLLRVSIPRGRYRIHGMLAAASLAIGAAAALAGLVFAGSRGSWVAAVIVFPLAWAAFTVRERAVRRRALIVAGGALVIGAAVLAAGGWQYIIERSSATHDNWLEAQEGEYTGGVAQRVMLARWAGRFFLESPIYGKGAGSFRVLSKQTPEFEEMERDQPRRAADGAFTPAHPHNAYLHLLAATGVIGTIPFLATLAIMLVRLWRGPRRRRYLFAGGAVFALIAWMVGTLSDCFTLNGHLFGLFGIMAALALLHWKPQSLVDEILMSRDSGAPRQ